MKATLYRRKGPASEVLEVADVPAPEPGDGEVRVRVLVSSVNPTDCKARAAGGTDSRLPSATAGEMPWPWQIPNQDGAGVIDAVGPGVDPGRVGERVWVFHAAAADPNGTAAEYTCVPALKAVRLPDGVPMDQAAGIGIPYITAHRCLFADGGIHGQTILVTGGAGSVGSAAVQLARWGGAERIVATVSSEEKAQIATASGASATVNYRAEDAAEQLRSAAPDGIDRVVDVALEANVASYLAAVRTHGTIAAYASGEQTTGPLPLGHLRRENVVLRFVGIYKLTTAMYEQAVSDITAALRSGALRPPPLHRFALDDIAAAHEAVESGAVGKVLVDIP